MSIGTLPAVTAPAVNSSYTARRAIGYASDRVQRAFAGRDTHGHERTVPRYRQMSPRELERLLAMAWLAGRRS